MLIKFIPLNKINAPDSFVEPAFLEELTGSIKEHKLNIPLILKPDGDNYNIIDGKKRFVVCKDLNYKELPAIIKEFQDEKEQVILSLILNLHRHTLTALEIAQSIDKLIKLEMSQRDIAKLINKSQAWVFMRHKILQLHPDVQKLAGPFTHDDNRLNVMQAYLLVDLPPEEQVKLATIISKDQLSVADARRLINKDIRENNIKINNKNTSRLNLVEDIKQVKQFIARTHEYLNNFLQIESKKFNHIFNGESLQNIERLYDLSKETAESMNVFIDCLNKIKESKISLNKEIEMIDEEKVDEKDNSAPEVNNINIRTASTTKLLLYLGVNKEDIYTKKWKSNSKYHNTLWKRQIDHIELLYKARQKYRERVKTIHPDVSKNKDIEDVAILNGVWDAVRNRFALHGFTLK